MHQASLKLAVIAGEASGDMLGADVIGALQKQITHLELIGVGGERMEAAGLVSLFDYTELSIMGVTAVLARLPQLLRRISQTADAIIAAKPDALLLIDSPDFTHRVARKVRAAMPGLPIVQYVCPSVWAWKEYRAQQMKPYVDRVLAVLPFEPAIMRRLDGPETSYIGHRLIQDENILKVRQTRARDTSQRAPTVLLLPGSRASEITRIAPIMGQAVAEIKSTIPDATFLLPAVVRQRALIETEIDKWPVKPEWAAGDEFKWAAFARADAAISTSGTALLELALAQVPTISVYKADIIMRALASRIKAWTGALPNLIADRPLIPEYLNEAVRPGALSRWMIELLDGNSPFRSAMLSGYEDVWQKMAVDVPPGEAATNAILDVIENKKADL